MKEALEKYFEAIKADYVAWGKPIQNPPPEGCTYREEQVKLFNEGLRYTEGEKYIKVISGSSVHSFIVKGGDGGKFKRGDILKPAGCNAPAKNKARGNIFGEYTIFWTGPKYLRG